MQLGNFCLCLAVKDIAASRAFYETLGFAQVGGDQAQGWLVLKHPSVKIGLFQGMFDRNMLTFNPGWDDDAHALESFTDIRDLQKHLLAKGIPLDTEADPATTGPAHIVMTDPDGNPIMLDQHV